ncbi:AI-2E family transporter (plasmid) [Rhizobium sp. RCAM05350]|nr:AI-2E family transporter [Rhizobium sp. RCAM05350]
MWEIPAPVRSECRSLSMQRRRKETGELVMGPLNRRIEYALGIGALALLAIGCALVLWPFLSAILWAAVICFSTWPIYCRCERAVGGNRAAAAAAMTLLVVFVVAAPLAFLVTALADDITNLTEGITRPGAGSFSATKLGEKPAGFWRELGRLLGKPYSRCARIYRRTQKADRSCRRYCSRWRGSFQYRHPRTRAQHIHHLLLFLHGRRLISFMRQIGERVAGPRARRLLTVIGMTVKGVVYGMIGTALAQGLLAGIGFWIAGVPQSLLLGCLTFALSFVPGGPPFVWGPVALWFLMQGSVGWGIFIAIWGLLLVSSIDNVLRPYLLNQNSNLPVLLGLFGLIGGVLAFGLIGLFLGPTLLAVAYNLFLEWVAAEIEERKQSASPSVAAGHFEAAPKD